MSITDASVIRRLVEGVLGPERSDLLFALLVIPPQLSAPGNVISRAAMAQALNMVLFDDLLARVPDAAAYARDCRAQGRRVLHDHGAMRTVALDGMGALPNGQEALVRLLRPLGYVQNGLYPLERLGMTGRSYAQADHPEDIAQFFISELHPERFEPGFQAAVRSVTASSKDPLTPRADAVLRRFADGAEVRVEDAAGALPDLLACFDRQHEPPAVTDYETLLSASAEMAWISTEGNAFNHATDRVPDVEALAAEQRALGRPMKDSIEVSRTGRVRQTAFRAARVLRPLRDLKGRIVEREVPGSFYEFISRDPVTDAATGVKALDLSFDSGNAQGIFKMTGTV